ncbi:MAG: 4Fe-4S cluster-binding domain-containing protein [Cyclobacteriaceae bacterium]|nr:4Fe-4S cluster-binding domain-containing protein [Cyclobacteriaceae bacterium]
MSKLNDYLKDPFLNDLYTEIRSAGALRSVSIDITSVCNLRCKGCYFFGEGMDEAKEGNEIDFDAWIENEKLRGTNMVTVVGGEPALQIERLRKLYKNFKINVATNGIVRIPKEGLEDLPIGIAIWGNALTDSKLRANGKRNLFKEALGNYKNDPRAFWYYTVAPGCADQIEEVTETCINNGNRVLFNYYSDLEGKGGEFDYNKGFSSVMNEIERMIQKYPEYILTTSYLNKVVGSGKLFNETWGYSTCTNISANNPVNAIRVQNGNLYNPHFRAYNADFKTTRRCCTGVDRNCDSCFDTWEHFSWIMLNMRKHLATKSDFANWLFVMYTFYSINRLFPVSKENIKLQLVQIHSWKESASLILE